MRSDLEAAEGVECVVCPPYLAVPDVARLLVDSTVAVGCQDVYWKESGAFTGEVAAVMAAEFCQYAIIGHSERREYFGETDQSVNSKIKGALAAGLVPIVCVGESLELRQAEKTESWIIGQLHGAFEGISVEQAIGIVIAYEPIWAIGTGLAATAEEAERVCGQVVRATLTELYGSGVAEQIRVQYGGSVNAGNAAELLAKPNIDGALVGGASLKAADFVTIVRAAQAQSRAR